MPVYEYLCIDCAERFSLLQRINATADETKCPKCSSGNVKKVMSAFCCSSSVGTSSSSFSTGGFSGGG